VTALFPGAQSGRAGEGPLALARPGRVWLGLVLLLPGGLLIALGLLAAWPGLALLVSGLRRMTAPSRGTVGDEIALPREQPYGQPCQPRPPIESVPWGRTFASLGGRYRGES
jgi:hypothetical protein